jgi:hypothetical protein
MLSIEIDPEIEFEIDLFFRAHPEHEIGVYQTLNSLDPLLETFELDEEPIFLTLDDQSLDNQHVILEITIPITSYRERTMMEIAFQSLISDLELVNSHIPVIKRVYLYPDFDNINGKIKKKKEEK